VILTREPRFSLAAILILALGLGANVTVFAVVHRVLLEPLPYRDPAGLVRIWERNASREIWRSRVSRGNYADWRRDARSFDAIEAFYDPSDALVQFDDEPEIVHSAAVTHGFMEMMGVRPLLGRADSDGFVLSYSFWQRRFGGDPSVIGRRIISEGRRGHPVTLIGVMPRGFDFPTGADIWATMSFGTEREARNVNVLARLRQGVSLEQARAEMTTLSARLATAYPAANAGWQADIEPFKATLVSDLRPRLWLLYLAVSLVMLIAIVNVGVLFVARGTRQLRDVAIRMALGATGWRIARQIFLECLLLAAAAAGLAAALAYVALRLMFTWAPASVPRLVEVGLDAQVLWMTAGLALGSAILLGMLGTARARLRPETLRTGQGDLAQHRSTVRTALFVGQVAACVCLLVVSAHVIRGFVALAQAPLGFEPSNLLTMQVRQPIVKPGEVVKHYPTRRFLRTAEAITAFASRLPGVREAGLAMYAPVAHRQATTSYRVLQGAVTGPLTGAPPLEGPDVRQASLGIVDSRFFAAAGVPLIEGRIFTAADRLDERQIDDFDADRGVGAAIINASLAHSLWPDKSPIGRHLAVSDASYRSVRVVGVVGDVLESPGQPPAPTIYLPYAQTPMDRFTLLVRTAGSPLSLAEPLRAGLRRFGTDVEGFNVRTMEQVVGTALRGPRFTSRVMSVFGVVAIVFTAVGLYTVLSFFVALRQRELAVRLAIGADPRQLTGWVIARGLRLSGLGVVLGLLATLASTRVLGSAVPGFDAGSPIAFAIVPALVMASAFAASYIPARRAAAVDPIAALKSE
jgi:predicted permease